MDIQSKDRDCSMLSMVGCCLITSIEGPLGKEEGGSYISTETVRVITHSSLERDESKLYFQMASLKETKGTSSIRESRPSRPNLKPERFDTTRIHSEGLRREEYVLVIPFSKANECTMVEAEPVPLGLAE